MDVSCFLFSVAEAAIPNNEIASVIDQALSDAVQQNVKGKDVRPFLLARVAAEIAKAL
jgi:pseudouridine-5'-phosphate glycosidase